MASPLLSLQFLISWRQDFRRLLDLVSSGWLNGGWQRVGFSGHQTCYISYRRNIEIWLGSVITRGRWRTEAEREKKLLIFRILHEPELRRTPAQFRSYGMYINSTY